MRTAALFLLSATAAFAAPVERDDAGVAVPLKHVPSKGTAADLVKNAKARVQKINGGSSTTSQAASGSAQNIDDTYVAGIKIGTGTYDLIVDTGSSNTWTNANNDYKTSSTSKDTGNSVEVSYGSGEFFGEEYTDKVTYAGLTVPHQSVGISQYAEGFQGVDGIVGFGPVDLTEDTVSNTNTVPTFMDNLYKQGSISKEVLGVYFHPESGSDDDDTNGELTLGGVDSSKYSGSITYFPKATSGSNAPYWGISVSSFSYNGKTLSGSAAGIVDTGTTLIIIPTAAYNAFSSATGGSTDSNSGLISFTKKPTANFAIKFGSTSYTLTPSQFLVPQAQYSNFGLTSGKYYGWFADGGDSGVNTIIGQKFLENYYSVFDTTSSRIGFATRT